ncbi:radical SAM protein [Cysteiniphilum litorale]|uniref:radical SAM protein n=1 Tax=Cysteiniphilum litorale TaxID=2056700 RepID=UPI003F884637
MIISYFKLSNYCNVGCSMCYIPQEDRHDKTKMSEETLKDAIRTTVEYAKRVNKSQVLVVLHGGEILSLSVDYLKAAFELLETEFSKSNLNYGFAVQSSLIPLKQTHIPVLKKYIRSIGSSMDFTGRTINGSNEAYKKLWLDKVDLARSNNLSVHPITVPNKNECGNITPVIDFFMAHGFKSINFERYNTFGIHIPTDDAPTNRDYSNMLIDAFDYVVKGNKSIVIRQIYEALTGVVKGKSAGRWGTTCMQDFLVFNPDGKINACPDKIDSEPAYSYAKFSVDKLMSSKVRQFWLKQSRLHHPHHNCMQCEFRRFCRSGCPITSNQQTGDACSGYKPFLKHIQAFFESEPQKVKEYMKLCETIY